MFPDNFLVQLADSAPASLANTPDLAGFSLADSIVGLAQGSAFAILIDHGI
jgi:hypothetical protein